MSMLRRGFATVGVLLAAVAAVGACGSQPGGDPVAGCTEETRSAGAPGDAEPLLVLGSQGFSPLIVYADGAVVLPTVWSGTSSAAASMGSLPMMAPGYGGEQPGGYLGGSLTDCELGEVIELADALFTADVDFGVPQVTDSDSTAVRYGAVTASIYAFSRTEPADAGLSRSQQQARTDLAALWDLIEDTTQTTGELEIERLFLYRYDTVTADELTDWPLSQTPEEIAPDFCGTISDPEQVRAMLDRLADPEPLIAGPVWEAYLLAVVAAAPGVTDCGY